MSFSAGGGGGPSCLGLGLGVAENWGRESEGEVSHLGSESESMRRKEAAWLLGGGGYPGGRNKHRPGVEHQLLVLPLLLPRHYELLPLETQVHVQPLAPVVELGFG